MFSPNMEDDHRSATAYTSFYPYTQNPYPDSTMSLGAMHLGQTTDKEDKSFAVDVHSPNGTLISLHLIRILSKYEPLEP